MSDVPEQPPPPPPVQPAEQPPDLGTTSTGLDPRLAATLAYSIWWVTGLVFLLLEPRNAYVRFHAMQSLVALGGLWAIGLGAWILGFLLLLVSSSAFYFMTLVGRLVWAAGLVLWLIALFKAYSGERWKAPVAGELAERLLSR